MTHHSHHTSTDDSSTSPKKRRHELELRNAEADTFLLAAWYEHLQMAGRLKTAMARGASLAEITELNAKITRTGLTIAHVLALVAIDATRNSPGEGAGGAAYTLSGKYNVAVGADRTRQAAGHVDLTGGGMIIAPCYPVWTCFCTQLRDCVSRPHDTVLRRVASSTTRAKQGKRNDTRRARVRSTDMNNIRLFMYSFLVVQTNPIARRALRAFPKAPRCR